MRRERLSDGGAAALKQRQEDSAEPADHQIGSVFRVASARIVHTGEIHMTKTALFVTALVMAAAGVFAQSSSSRTFTGEIMDSNCAKMGSHTAMMKEHNIPNAATCTKGCVQAGAKYVLYNPATKTTYELDNQSKPAAFAGQEVKVNGKLDAATDTIHVDSISPAT
jgi:hypothetical protein